MEPLRRAAPALLLLLACPSALPAAPVTLQPSAAAARVAVLAEPLAAEDLLEAALAFSGTPAPELESARRRARALLAAAGGVRADSERERAERLLELLHRELFREYEERQTRLDVLLATGRFNCVSSAVLYGLLARSLGLEFRAVQAPDHVLIRVLAAAGAGWDVETTSPYGFEPGTRKEFTDSFGRVTGYSYVPPTQYSRRRELGDKGLLAMILYNRNAYDTERGLYLEALGPAVDAFALHPDPESRDRLVSSLLNVGSFFGLEGRYGEGAGFLTEAARAFPDPRLDRLRGDLLHNWVVSLIAERRLEQALELLAERRAELSETEWRSLAVTAWQLRAQEAARSDFAAAAALALRALREVGPDASLQGSYEVYVHNQAVSLIRAGRPADALGVVRTGLQVLPGSRRLREDEVQIRAQIAQ